jgi:O-methyltransferase involved in polyketide biosynthesis
MAARTQTSLARPSARALLVRATVPSVARRCTRAQYLVALRAKRLDDCCADFLVRHPDAVVLHLGCGLDGRAFWLAPPPSVLWSDLDQPGVIELRRRLSDDSERYRMIGSSVTDPRWLDQIPTGRPTLVVAEGLLMYVGEPEVRELLDRVTDGFDSGELLFDTLSPLSPKLSKVMTRGIIKWGIGNARDMETWNPRLRFREQTSILAGYRKIESTPVGGSTSWRRCGCSAPTTC